MLFIVLGLLAVLLLFNWNWLRGPLERYVSEKTQREFSISSLDVEWGLTPTVVMENVKFANADWASDPKPMAQIGKLSFSVSLRDLWEKKLLVPRAALSNADLLFEKSKDDRTNWVLKEPDESSEPSPLRIGSISVDNGTLRYVDHGEPFEVTVKVNTFEPEARQKATDAAAAPDNRKFATRYTFAGSYHDAPFKGQARTGEILSFQETDIPFPIQGSLDANTTQIPWTAPSQTLQKSRELTSSWQSRERRLLAFTLSCYCRCLLRRHTHSKGGSSKRPTGMPSKISQEK